MCIIVPARRLKSLGYGENVIAAVLRSFTCSSPRCENGFLGHLPLRLMQHRDTSEYGLVHFSQDCLTAATRARWLLVEASPEEALQLFVTMLNLRNPERVGNSVAGSRNGRRHDLYVRRPLALAHH